jgi:hypothetical protein
MLNEFSAMLYLSFFLIFSYPLGCLICKLLKLDLKVPFFAAFPIYSALGLTTLTLILTIIGFISINGSVLLAILIAVSLCYLIPLFIRYTKHKTGNSLIEKRSVLQAHTLVPIVLLFALLIYFSFVVGQLGWSPYGDAINHGLITSLFANNHKIQLSYSPVSSATLDNPFGFHVIAADFSLLTGLFPGESIFVLSAVITILVPLLLYSLAYVLTSSVMVSLSVFFSSFFINPQLNLETYLVGYLYNGPYPNLFGFLGLTIFAIFVVINEKISQNRSIASASAIFLLITVFLVITYPSFAVFPVIYGLIKLRRLASYFKYRRKNILLIAIAFLLILSLFVFSFQEIISTFSTAITSKFVLLMGNFSAYSIPFAFIASISGIATIFAVFTAIFFILKRIYLSISIFYLIIALPCFVSLVGAVAPFTAIILPSRSFVFVSLISWVLIMLLVFFTVSSVSTKRINFFKKGIDIRFNKSAVLSLVLACIVFAPSLLSTFDSAQANQGWFGLTGGSEDYTVLAWVSDNIPSTDLIMNDYSYTSLFLQSFAIKNVTCKQTLSGESDIDRATAVHAFWKTPSDYMLFANLVKEYNISYVLVTSEDGYRDWAPAGGDGSYKPKPFGKDTIQVFDNNPYLIPVFKIDSAGVFQVINDFSYAFKTTGVQASNESSFWSENLSGSGSIGSATLEDLDNYEYENCSLEINIGQGNNAHFELRHWFDDPQNWSNQSFVVFNWNGNNTGMLVQVYVKGPTIGDYKRYDFLDNWSGLGTVMLPLQVPSASYGSPDLNKVVEIQFTLVNAPQGTWNLSGLTLLSRKD